MQSKWRDIEWLTDIPHVALLLDDHYEFMEKDVFPMVDIIIHRLHFEWAESPFYVANVKYSWEKFGQCSTFKGSVESGGVFPIGPSYAL